MGITGQIEQHEIDAYLGHSKAAMTPRQYYEFCKWVHKAGPDADWDSIAKQVFGDEVIGAVPADRRTICYVQPSMSMMVWINGDEVAVTYYTDGVVTGSEIETLARWNSRRAELEHDGWIEQS
jgi:hypothetical protein